MRQLFYFLLVLALEVLMARCQKIDSITAPNPIIGQWNLEAWQVYHLPTWYAIKTNERPIITATDTIYAGPAPQFFNVKSLTFTAKNGLSEDYYQPPGYVELRTIQTDHGTWTLADSTVNLSISNSFPHKLTYRAATNQLITDIHSKTSVIQFTTDSSYTINYSIRLYYSKLP